MRTYYPNAATRSPVAPSPAVTESMECEADSEEETPLRPAALAPKQQHPLAILSHTPVPTRSRPGRALATLQEEQGEGRHGVEGEGEAAEQQQQGQEQDQGQAQAQAQAQEQDGELETVAVEPSTCRATTPLQDAQRARTTNSGLADLAVTAPPPAPSTTLPTLPTLSTPVAPFTPEPVAVAAPKAKGEGAQAAGAARPFICAVPGCEKDYMDQQGLDQHPELPLQRPAPGEAGAPIGVGSRVVDSAGTLGEIIARNAAWLTMRTDAGEERNVRKQSLKLVTPEAGSGRARRADEGGGLLDPGPKAAAAQQGAAAAAPGAAGAAGAPTAASGGAWEAKRRGRSAAPEWQLAEAAAEPEAKRRCVSVSAVAPGSLSSAATDAKRRRRATGSELASPVQRDPLFARRTAAPEQSGQRHATDVGSYDV